MQIRHAAVITLALLSIAPTHAHAQPARNPAAADDLFQRAKELLKEGNWAEGCAKLQASMDLDPAVATLLKIARCHEHDGKLALARHDYEAALALNGEKPGQTEERRRELEDFARAALRELEPRVPKVRIVVGKEPPAGLRVTCDGQALPIAALSEDLPLDPGHHEIVAEATGFASDRHPIDLSEGKREEVTIEWHVVVAAPPAATSTPTPSQPPTSAAAPARASSTSGRRMLGYALAGAGAVGFAVAGFFGWETLSKVNDSSPYCDGTNCQRPGFDLRNEARTTQTIGFVALGLGAALAGAGVVVLVTAPRETQPPAAMATLRGSW